MALTPEQSLQLAELRAARIKIGTGQGVAEVTSNGRSVKYSQANLGLLDRLIGDLERLEGQPVRRRGAVGFRL